jgi:hypothetical protein
MFTPSKNVSNKMVGCNGVQGYFCDRTRRNAVPEVLSQKNESWNSVPELFFFLALV